MENKKSSSKTLAIIALVAVLAISFFIPAEHWSGWISKGDSVSPGIISNVDRASGKTTIQIGTATANGNAALTNTYITIDGAPANAAVGQSVQVGYSKDGLYADTNQKVQVALWEKGNFFTVNILGLISPVEVGAATYKIVDVKSDGTDLKYYVSSGSRSDRR